MAYQVLRKARLLRLKEGFKSVYMCPDRTFEERQAHKKLLQELKLKHAAYPDKFFAIRNNEVVSVCKNSCPAHGVELLFAFSWLTFRKCFHGSQSMLCFLCSWAIWMRSWIFLHLPVFGYPVKYTLTTVNYDAVSVLISGHVACSWYDRLSANWYCHSNCPCA